MELLLCRAVLLSALFSAWCAAQQRTGDGRVILNLGYFASFEGGFISSGKLYHKAKLNCTHAIINRSTAARHHIIITEAG